MSTDPLGGSVGDLQSHNAYAYVLNNPLNYVDPTGMTCYQIVNNPYGDGIPDYRAVSLNQGECRKAGFTWIDDVDTTVIVYAGGDGGSGGAAAGGLASDYPNGGYM